MARRDHPVGLPVRDRATSTWPMSGSIAGLADDLTTGTLDLTVTVGFPGRDLPPGWTRRGAPRRARDETLRAEAAPVDRTSLARLDARRPAAHVPRGRGPARAGGRGGLGRSSTAGWRRRSTAS